MRTLIGAAAAAIVLAGAPLALAHQGNPNMRSAVTAITPQTDGITVTVLNNDDRLELHNTSGEDVVIEGYSGEPYARVLGDGTVAVNTNSEAYYLNDDRYGDVKVPQGLGSEPKWKKLSGTGRFEWHDHRMHWMSRSKPPQVAGRGREGPHLRLEGADHRRWRAGPDRRHARLGAAAGRRPADRR